MESRTENKLFFHILYFYYLSLVVHGTLFKVEFPQYFCLCGIFFQGIPKKHVTCQRTSFGNIPVSCREQMKLRQRTAHSEQSLGVFLLVPYHRLKTDILHWIARNRRMQLSYTTKEQEGEIVCFDN